MLIDRIDDAFPHGLGERRIRHGILSNRHTLLSPLCVGVPRLAGLDQVMDFFAPRILEEFWVRLLYQWCKTQVLCMVRHNEKIERTDQASSCPARCHDHLALGEAQRFVRPEPVSNHAGVSGIGGVEMRIAPEHAVGVALVKVGRILLPADLDVFLGDSNVLR